MGKIFLGAIVGIFLGALVVEILNQKKPELTKEIESRAKNTVRAFAAAFKEGYGISPDKSKA